MATRKAKIPKTGLDAAEIKKLGKNLFVKPIDQRRTTNRRLAATNEKEFLKEYDEKLGAIDTFVQGQMLTLRTLLGDITGDPEESTEIALGMSRNVYSALVEELDKMYPFHVESQVTIGKKPFA